LALISKNFIKTSFIYTVAGALPMASGILLLPIYVTDLPSSVYGALSLYLTFSLFVQIVVTYSFDSSTYIHYHEYKNDPKKLASFMSSAFILMLLIGIGVGVVLVFLGEFLFDLIFNDQKISFYPYGLISVAVGICQALTKVYSTILQSRERPASFLWSNLLLFSLIALLTIIGLKLYPGTLAGPLGGRLIAGGVVAGWSLLMIFREFGFHFDWPLLKSTFSFNNYTFIHQVQQWVINYIDRFLMVFFLPLSAAGVLSTVGIYDFALKCMVVIELITNGFHNSFYPKIVKVITAQADKGYTPELSRYYHGLSAVVMVMVSSAIFVLPLVIYMFNSKQGYEEAIQYFPYIAVLYIIRALRLYFAIPYGVLKYTKPLPVISAVIAAVKIGMMIVLLKDYGIYGVVAATLVTSVLEIIIMKVKLSDRFHYHYNVFKMVVVPAMMIAAVLILEPIFGQQYSWQLHLFYLVMTGALLLWVYRNELKLLNIPKMFG